MKIVINAASAKMSGAVTYLSNLLPHLPSPESGYEFYLFLPGETAATLSKVPANVRLYPISDESVNGWRRIWWEQVTLRRFLSREKIDALFSSANFAMFHCPVRQLLLVRNAIYFSELYQQMFLPKHPLKMRIDFRLRRWLICRSVAHSEVVMTPTQAMLDDLRRFVKVDTAKTQVNRYGVKLPSSLSEPSSKPDARLQPSSPSGVRLVYISLYSEHKNLTTLLKALPLLNHNGGGRYLLKTTVNPAWAGAAWTKTHMGDVDLARRPDVAPWVEFFGPLRTEQIQDIYREGDVFVFPSFCESFGHPLVEAMVHGLPIVAADTPVNREICGEAALYFRPLDPKDLAEKVALLGRDRALREKLGTTGRLRAPAHFRWDEHVRGLLQAVDRPSSGITQK